MSQTYGIEAPDGGDPPTPRRTPARYLVVIDPSDQASALLFTEDRRQVGEFAAGSEEVAVMTRGLVPALNAADAGWDAALGRYAPAQRQGAEIYTLDV